MTRRKRKGEREPKPPMVSVPATFEQAREAEIIAGIDQWRSKISTLGSDVWVLFHDLPPAPVAALRDKA